MTLLDGESLLVGKVFILEADRVVDAVNFIHY
jgi:hypothetical protein